MRLYARDRAIRALAPAGHRVRADPARALDRPRPPRLRDRGRPGGVRRRRSRAPRLQDQRDGPAALGRRARRSPRRPRRLDARLLRTVSEHSFEEDPLRLVRGLRFVSQLDFEPDEWTLAQMEEHAELVTIVSGERVGGGLAADGMGELSKLLLGRRAAQGAAPRPRHRRARRAPPRVRPRRSSSTRTRPITT